MTHDTPPRLLTSPEVAAYFRVHPKTVTRWANQGLIAFTRTLGNRGQFRFSEDEVKRLAATRGGNSS